MSLFDELQGYRPKAVSYDGQPWARAQVKLDGWRIGVCIENGLPVFFGRKPRDLDLHGLQCMDQFRHKPEGSMFDCELYYPLGQATDVPRAIKEQDPLLKATVFGVYRWGDQEITTWDQYDAAMKYFVEPDSYTNRPQLTRERLLQEAKDLDLEGWVLKEFPHKNWYKLKVTHTTDARVVGCYMGDGKSFMKVGSLEIVTEEGYRGTVKLQDEEDRIWFHGHKKYIGRVLEVTYDAVTRDGRLKFARFIRWRDDKPWKSN